MKHVDKKRSGSKTVEDFSCFIETGIPLLKFLNRQAISYENLIQMMNSFITELTVLL